MTKLLEAADSGGMAEKRKATEAMAARFLPGTFDEIDGVLERYENRMDFVRKAVDAEIARRKSEKDQEKK